MGHLGRAMGLLGLFLTVVSLSPRFLPVQATDTAAGRRSASSPEGKMIGGTLLCYSGGRWGSCPTLPHGEP